MFKGLSSLRLRIAVFIGLLVTVLWIGASVVTVKLLMHEVEEVFDRDLRATAEQILPIVLHEKFEEDDDHSEIVGPKRGPDIRYDGQVADDVEYIVTSSRYGLLLRSGRAVGMTFPADPGFHTIGDWRFFVDVANREDVTIAVGRPLAARHTLAQAVFLAMSLPLLIIIPLTLVGIYVLVGRGLRPVALVEQEMGRRGPEDLSPIPTKDVPRELLPLVESGNRLLERIQSGFEAERSFASNAAHEMRTPLAGAIAQAQRLQAESKDGTVIARAGDIEASLKRLSRYGEKLMQLARAEGARLRTDTPIDVRPVVQIVLEDFTRRIGEGRLSLDLPAAPVLSDLDPDALGIVLRNLVENALTHGAENGAIEVQLSSDRRLSVSNEGANLSEEALERLSQRFMRGDGAGNGSGLGLSIVQIIAERSGAEFKLSSPLRGDRNGVEGCFKF